MIRVMLLLLTASAASSTVAPAGFIGLGIMGDGMAKCMLKAGRPLHVWSRDKAVCERFAASAAKEEGYASVVIEESPAAVVAAVERTYLMLPTPDACEQVYSMDGGVLEGLAKGKQLVDCATLRPGDMRSLADRVKAKGGKFVEAPVSGSKAPAASGSLIFMAAGDRATFDAASDDLAAMGKRSVFVSESVGTATKMKLVVNMIMGAQLAALAEGVALAEGIGLSASDLQDVLDDGAMASPLVSLKGPLMSRSAFDAAFPLKYALKDMRFALELDEASGLNLGVSGAATSAYAEAADNLNLGESDFSAVVDVSRKPKPVVNDLWDGEVDEMAYFDEDGDSLSDDQPDWRDVRKLKALFELEATGISDPFKESDSETPKGGDEADEDLDPPLAR